MGGLPHQLKSMTGSTRTLPGSPSQALLVKYWPRRPWVASWVVRSAMTPATTGVKATARVNAPRRAITHDGLRTGRSGARAVAVADAARRARRRGEGAWMLPSAASAAGGAGGAV